MRAERAQRLVQAPSDLGARLAGDLQRCIGERAVPPSGQALLAMGCDAAPRRSLALGPEKLIKLGSDSDADDGPTFEVRPREVLRKDPPPRQLRPRVTSG
jgi:hypothetical protein